MVETFNYFSNNLLPRILMSSENLYCSLLQSSPQAKATIHQSIHLSLSVLLVDLSISTSTYTHTHITSYHFTQNNYFLVGMNLDWECECITHISYHMHMHINIWWTGDNTHIYFNLYSYASQTVIYLNVNGIQQTCYYSLCCIYGGIIMGVYKAVAVCNDWA